MITQFWKIASPLIIALALDQIPIGKEPADHLPCCSWEYTGLQADVVEAHPRHRLVHFYAVAILTKSYCIPQLNDSLLFSQQCLLLSVYDLFGLPWVEISLSVLQLGLKKLHHLSLGHPTSQ